MNWVMDSPSSEPATIGRCASGAGSHSGIRGNRYTFLGGALEAVRESAAVVAARSALGDHAVRGLVVELADFEAADDQPVARHVVSGEEAAAQVDESGFVRAVARLHRVPGSPGRLAEHRALQPPALEDAEVDPQIGLAAEIGIEVLAGTDEEVD